MWVVIELSIDDEGQISGVSSVCGPFDSDEKARNYRNKKNAEEHWNLYDYCEVNEINDGKGHGGS